MTTPTNDDALEALLRAALDAIPAPALIADCDGATRFANERGRGWLAKTRRTTLGSLRDLPEGRVTAVADGEDRHFVVVGRVSA